MHDIAEVAPEYWENDKGTSFGDKVNYLYINNSNIFRAAVLIHLTYFYL